MRSILSRCSSVKGLSGRNGDGSGRTHLYLNVYDLTPANNYLYWFGIGVFHSGIEVHGMEYGFGAHDYSSSGVFEVEPKSCPGFIFRRSVWLGTTDMSRSEFRVFIEDLAGKYHGKPIPGWVNRLARLGSFCNCILPENIQVTAVGQLPANPAFSEDGSVSYASSSIDESDEEDADHHLLKKPNGDFVHSNDVPLRIGRDDI
ncbi:hypothetical protein OPV22_004189 [Ensete ventricosum]|uniref:PPPDE domain-containing protein n=1 Tax=Ensete ventricosum TaxID=4639 RepID=A0AAV8S319_ENSVE|nr:hypothetical protein OPV22_004189 [Ensete ventricosum]